MTLLETKSSKIKYVTLINVTKTDNTEYLNILDRVTSQKWFVKITLVINRDFILENEISLIDSGATINCIQEGIFLTRYFSKTTQSLTQAGGDRLRVKYKLSNAYIYNKDVCLPTSFVFVGNLTHRIIL